MGCPSGMVWFARRVSGGEMRRWRKVARKETRSWCEEKGGNFEKYEAGVMRKTSSLTFRVSHVTVLGAWHDLRKLWWADAYRGCGEGRLALRAVGFGLRGGFGGARCVGGEKWVFLRFLGFFIRNVTRMNKY